MLMLNTHEKNNYSLRWKGHQRRIGITGGIASGKSSVGAYLKEKRNWPILDADKYAKIALEPNTFAYKKIIARYGPEILMQATSYLDQRIDRSKLAQIIFNHKNERLWLEKIIHPSILKQFKDNLILYHNASVVVLIIPLLFEAKWNNLCSEIWIIDCKVEQQYERLKNRDKITQEEIKKRINAQFSLEFKRKLGDIIIDNSQQLEHLHNQIVEFI